LQFYATQLAYHVIICTHNHAADSSQGPELEFLTSLWGLGTEDEEVYRTGPPGYIDWRNSFLGSIPGPHTRLKIRAQNSIHICFSVSSTKPDNKRKTWMMKIKYYQGLNAGHDCAHIVGRGPVQKRKVGIGYKYIQRPCYNILHNISVFSLT
jgi:hypothetical protein